MMSRFSRLNGVLKRVAVVCAVPFTLLLATNMAHSHAGPFGISGYPALVLHPFYVLDHALCLLSAALLAGQQKTLRIPWAIASLLLGLFVGFACLVLLPGFPGDVFLPVISAVLIGLLVALAPRLNHWAVAAIVMLAGFSVGLNTYPEAGLMVVFALTLGGLMLGATLLFTLAAWLVSRPTKDWQRIGIRIAGSWIAAICCLLLALAFKG